MDPKEMRKIHTVNKNHYKQYLVSKMTMIPRDHLSNASHMLSEDEEKLSEYNDKDEDDSEH